MDMHFLEDGCIVHSMQLNCGQTADFHESVSTRSTRENFLVAPKQDTCSIKGFSTGKVLPV